MLKNQTQGLSQMPQDQGVFLAIKQGWSIPDVEKMEFKAYSHMDMYFLTQNYPTTNILYTHSLNYYIYLALLIIFALIFIYSSIKFFQCVKW